MQQRNFYNRAGAEAVAGSANFAAVLVAEAAGLGITPAQATAYGLVNTALQGAWATATTPETRTSVAIEAKDNALRNMRRAAVPLAKQIAGNPAVTDAKLVALGLLPRTSPGPRPATMTPPVLAVLEVKRRLVKARVTQAGVVDSKAKPLGSAGALVYSCVAPVAPTDPAEYKFEGLVSRPVFEVLFPDDVPNGATVWITAAWVSARGQRGFACDPVSATIQGGPALPAAI